MKKLTACILISTAVLAACTQKPADKNIPTVGELDSLDVAADTLRQLGLENSYEYSHTLNVGGNTAYDILAYGGPAANGKFHIIKRSANNRQDTLVTTDRHGLIGAALAADLDHNGKNEIYIAIQQPVSLKLQNLFACEDDGRKGLELTMKDDTGSLEQLGYAGKDSFYTTNNQLVRTFSTAPAGKQPGQRITIYYNLNNHTLVPGNKKTTATGNP